MFCFRIGLSMILGMMVFGCTEDASVPVELESSGVEPGEEEGNIAGAESPEAVDLTGLNFPNNFLIGTATAGFQVDMGCPGLSSEECDDTGSDWYAFVTDPITMESLTTYLSGDPISDSPGHWELYEEDLDLVANTLGNNAYRFSMEWSRIFPTATDDAEGYDDLKALADPAAVAQYHAMLDAMAERGITPMVTLNHYTLPLWIHDAVGCHQNIKECSPKGWVDRERTVQESAKYAGFLAKEFGGKVDLWATLNEPLAVVLPGYVLPQEDRTNPPAVVLALDEARIVLRALVEAHARMYDAVHAEDEVDALGDGEAAQVGLVYNLAAVHPTDPENPLDTAGQKNLIYLYNELFLDAVIRGELDDNLDGVTEFRPDLEGRMDYLGINYYTRLRVIGTETSSLPDLSPLLTIDPFALNTWDTYPKGLYEVTMWAWERYKLPIYITENGSPIEGDGEDIPRILVEHLTWLARALRDGADVRGYFFWSLIDNYEWNHGLSLRFGLFGLEQGDVTKKRIPRAAVETFSEISGAMAVPDALAAKYPVKE